MGTRSAACSCEQLRLVAEGDPTDITICHCLACQRRTGSPFSVQAAYHAERVRTEGRYSEYVRLSDKGEARTFSFCPECGATVFFKLAASPRHIVVPVGAFADPSFPAPTMSVREVRRHPWVELPEDMTRYVEDDPD
jgi:hypothetical protein